MPLFSTRLPAYGGKYGVGVVDVETPCSGPTGSGAVFKKSGKPAFELQTVLFSLYYPTTHTSTPTKPHHHWVSKPIIHAGRGYARFAHISNPITDRLFTFGLWLLVGSTQIPAKVDVPIIEGSDKFPVVVFSHGMASSRTSYSQFFGELASRGVVVAAVEHRDGSGPGSVVMRGEGEEGLVEHFGLGDLRREPPMDTAALKHDQLAFRQAEVVETVRVLRRIAGGQGAQVFADNRRNEGEDFASFKDRLDLDSVVIGGHSYGGTLALQTLSHAPSTTLPFKGAIVLDPGKHSGPLNTAINIPLLVIHSNSWSSSYSIFQGRPHFDVVKDLVQGVLDRGHAAWFLTSLGTSHPSVTDAPLLEPTLLSWTTGSTIDVRQGITQYVTLSLQFLDFLKSRRRKGVLALDVTHTAYDTPAPGHAEKEDQVEAEGRGWQVHVAPTR